MLVVPVDVGKRFGMALVADLHGEVVVEPFSFEMTRPGVCELLSRVAGAEDARAATVVRVGVEAAGHYHRSLVETLRVEGVEVVELHPGAVYQARSEMGKRRLKSDLRDLAAMAEMLARGAGRPSKWGDGPLARQAAWAAHRHAKVRAKVALGNQLLSQLDLIFPGLGGCFGDLLEAKGGLTVLRHCPDPLRVRRMGPEGLRRYVGNRGVRMTRPKAAQIVEAARGVLLVPEEERRTRLVIFAADMALYDTVAAEISRADAELTEVIGDTPAGVLLSLPGIGIARASAYGGSLGDPWRFRDAAAAWRYSGLVPVEYQSAGKRRGGLHISREGSTPLREAILELGRGLSGHQADFKAYKAKRIAEGKKKTIAAVAVAHRAHRLAFSMMRTQTGFDPQRWARSVAAGRSVMADAEAATSTT